MPALTLPFAVHLRAVALFAAMLAALFALSGCVSSSTSYYAGSSVSSATASLKSARADRKSARRDLRAARRDLKKLERNIARNERRAKRRKNSAKFRAKAAAAVKRDRRKLNAARRAVRAAERRVARADRNIRRANRNIATAKRSQAEAERRIAAAEERRKRRDQEIAQAAIARQGSSSSSSGFGLGFLSGSSRTTKVLGDYGARVDGGFQLAAIPVSKIAPNLLRQRVSYRSRHKPGTVIVDTGAKYLYVVERGNQAMRYGIGVGREGFAWSGEAHIGFKRQWPKWTPPVEMIERQPELAKYCADCGGMPGGPANPLGARALYLVANGKDTLYRLHGTPKWNSIGTAASSGCIRLINQDVIDLYNRVPTGAKVVVM